jgi:hypothetical protein
MDVIIHDPETGIDHVLEIEEMTTVKQLIDLLPEDYNRNALTLEYAGDELDMNLKLADSGIGSGDTFILLFHPVNSMGAKYTSLAMIYQAFVNNHINSDKMTDVLRWYSSHRGDRNKDAELIDGYIHCRHTKEHIFCEIIAELDMLPSIDMLKGSVHSDMYVHFTNSSESEFQSYMSGCSNNGINNKLINVLIDRKFDWIMRFIVALHPSVASEILLLDGFEQTKTYLDRISMCSDIAFKNAGRGKYLIAGMNSRNEKEFHTYFAKHYLPNYKIIDNNITTMEYLFDRADYMDVIDYYISHKRSVIPIIMKCSDPYICYA